MSAFACSETMSHVGVSKLRPSSRRSARSSDVVSDGSAAIGCSPVHRIAMMTPMPHTSTDWSYSTRLSTSGAAYLGW